MCINNFNKLKLFDGANNSEDNYSPLIMNKSITTGVHSQNSAMKYNAQLAGLSVDKEMNKLNKFSTMKVIKYSELPIDGIVLQSFFVYADIIENIE